VLDDLLDGDFPLPCEKAPAAAAYAMLSLTLGAALSPKYAVALFLAAYVTGMVRESDGIYPFGHGLWESVVILGFASYFAGLRIIIFAVFAMFAVQLADDLLDWRRDLLNRQDNLALRFGWGEAALGLLISALSALALEPVGAILVFLAAPVSVYTAKILERKLL
jgi:hypothetical protein